VFLIRLKIQLQNKENEFVSAELFLAQPTAIFDGIETTARLI